MNLRQSQAQGEVDRGIGDGLCGGLRRAVKTNPIRAGFPGNTASYGLALGAATLRLEGAECVDGAVPIALGGLLAAKDLL